MIVRMPTKAQAVRVAKLTGGVVVVDDQGRPTSKIALDDFEAHREVIESVSVLFPCYDDDGAKVPSGWVVTGASFEVEWPREPKHQSRILSHVGALRSAKNWAIARVKADLDAREQDPDRASAPWTLEALRKRWHQVKDEVTPWSAEHSKECCSSGVADPVWAFNSWSNSKCGRRKGRRVSVSRLESKRCSTNQVCFATGAVHLEPHRRYLTLPVIGTLRSKQHIRRVERHVANDNARILSMTLSERRGRLFVSVHYAEGAKVVCPTGHPPAKPDARAGVDLGLHVLATIADTDGSILEVPNPAPLRATLTERRGVVRRLSRRTPGSRGHQRAKAKRARLDGRTVCLCRESVHRLTRQLVDTYGEVVVADLDLAAIKRPMGRRALRRAVSDTGLGDSRPTLACKAERSRVRLALADHLSPSSRIHHGCDGVVAGPKLAKRLTCEVCHSGVDPDANAARNLRDRPDHANPGSVGATAPRAPKPLSGATDVSFGGRLTDHRTRRRTTNLGLAVVAEASTDARAREQRNPARGASA